LFSFQHLNRSMALEKVMRKVTNVTCPDRNDGQGFAGGWGLIFVGHVDLSGCRSAMRTWLARVKLVPFPIERVRRPQRLKPSGLCALIGTSETRALPGRRIVVQRFVTSTSHLQRSKNSVVPPGLGAFVPPYPGLPSWAKLGRPAGLGFSSYSQGAPNKHSTIGTARAFGMTQAG
jgi:hypothetical protein